MIFFFISIRISLKFVPSGQIDNKPVLVHVMAWCRTGDKPLAEPMLTQLTDGGGGGGGGEGGGWVLTNAAFLFSH